MQNLNKIIGAVCLFVGLNACDVLDQEPQTEISESIAITNQKGAEAAVAGMYNELQDDNYYGRNIQIMSDIAADISQSVGSWDHYREMDTYVTSIGNTENGYLWTRAYQAINVANNVLDAVPGLTDVNEERANTFLGQAYFVRALAMFDLTRTFGGVPGEIGSLGVPIVTTPSRQVDDSLFPSRPTLEASYQQVEDDLLMALDLLPEAFDDDGTTRSQAVKGTARALLCRLYLYTGEYAQVITYADQVIDDEKYTLMASYPDIFQGKLTSEAIFELNFNASDPSGIRYWYFPASLGGRGDIGAHTSFYEEISADPNDSRGQMFGFNESAGVYYPLKYQKGGDIDNIQVLRIAEMYLNRAEAKAQTGDIAGALVDLNTIRDRAGVEPVSASTATAALQAIWHERKFEFAFEGHRFFDLVRTGQALTDLASVDRTNGPAVSLTDPNRQVFPIPSFDIDANSNLVQNDAYK